MRSRIWPNGGTSPRRSCGSGRTWRSLPIRWVPTGRPERRGGAARVGKRLGFVVQEMNREANTIAAKANDAAISAAAVVVKEKLEVVREQLENVE